MTYYILRQASDPEVIGVKNGAYQAKIIRELFSDASHYDRFVGYFLSNDPSAYFSRLGTFPDFEVKLEYVQLAQGVKLTDFLSYFPNLHHGGNFLVRENVLRILSEFHLPPFKVYDVNVCDGQGVFADYKLLYCPPLGYEVIDFQQTIFFTGNELFGKDFFHLQSGREYEAKKAKETFRVEKLVLKKELPIPYDYFLCKTSTPSIFISDRLKQRFEAEKLTGVIIAKSYEPSIELD